MGRRAVFEVAIGQRPKPWRAHGRGGGLEDAADDLALTQHVVVVVTPLAPWARGRGALEREIVFVHVSAAAHRPRRALRLYRGQKTPSQKCLDPPSRRGLRRTATGRRAKRDRATWRPFPPPIRRGSDQAAPLTRVDGLEPRMKCLPPRGRTAGHLSGSDRAARCPTEKSPPRGDASRPRPVGGVNELVKYADIDAR